MGNCICICNHTADVLAEESFLTIIDIVFIMENTCFLEIQKIKYKCYFMLNRYIWFKRCNASLPFIHPCIFYVIVFMKSIYPQVGRAELRVHSCSDVSFGNRLVALMHHYKVVCDPPTHSHSLSSKAFPISTVVAIMINFFSSSSGSFSSSLVCSFHWLNVSYTAQH